MAVDVRLPEWVKERLRCPACRKELHAAEGGLQCIGCSSRFPVVGGVPVLIDEESSIFCIAEIAGHAESDGHAARRASGLRLRRFIPTISRNVSAKENMRRLRALLAERSPHPRVLVVGGATLGQGMEALAGDPDVQLVETDVVIGPRTGLVADAHRLPFADGTFDAVVMQAVVEYLVEPAQAADEVHRVLVKDGLVYSEMPFMQQVHGGATDFSRLTHVGHRRLFRRFEEVESGLVCGPGMALAWAWQYFLLSFTESRRMRKFLWAFSSLTAFWLKYFDCCLVRKAGSYDAGSGFYFMGQKAEEPLPDREVLRSYRGMQ